MPMTETETILALEDALLLMVAALEAMDGAAHHYIGLDNLVCDLDELTDDMRAAQMEAGPPVHHATPKGSGWDGTGSPTT